MSAQPDMTFDEVGVPDNQVARGTGMSPGRLALLLIVWLGLCVAGLAMLWKYKSTPGAIGAVPKEWPAASGLGGPHGKPLLMMFAHPMCPCTVASMSELRELISKVGAQMDAEVVFIRPEDEAEDWSEGSARKTAQSIGGLRLLEDKGGNEARRFGALTSGHVLLYGTDGQLLFSGGITSARGHEGENAGVDSIAAILQRQAGARSNAPVFGCGLDDPDPKGS